MRWIYFSFSYWKSRLPRQGWLYLSVNHMCFYAYILARETKLTVRWTDITELSKTNSLIVPDSIRVVTRDNKEVYVNVHTLCIWQSISCQYLTFSFVLQHYFSMFLHKSETYSLMEQLTNIAMKRY